MPNGFEFDRHSLWRPANRCVPGRAQCGRVQQETKSGAAVALTPLSAYDELAAVRAPNAITLCEGGLA